MNDLVPVNSDLDLAARIIIGDHPHIGVLALTNGLRANGFLANNAEAVELLTRYSAVTDDAEITLAAVKDVIAAIETEFRRGSGPVVEARAAIAAARPHLTAAKDVEITRLRAERDAWKAHATHLESRPLDIWVLTERPARKCNGLDHDDVCTVAELADAPSAPAQEGQTT